MKRSYQSHADWTKRSSPGKKSGAKNSPVRHSKAWLRKRKKRRRIILLVWSALLCAALIVLVISVSLFLNKTEIGADSSSEEGGDALETVTEGISTAEEVEITVSEDSVNEEVEDTEVIATHDTPDISNLSWPFTTMSLDWDESVLEGWWHYDIPSSYAEAGGYLPDAVQVYIYALCKDYAIDYPTVLAVIEVESGYVYDAVSDEDAIGYMQVVLKWHEERMENLFGSSAEEILYNPYTNIRVGIDFLAELYADYESMEMALTAYNLGVTGAEESIFSTGETDSDYASEVMRTAERIREELYLREMEVTCGE